MKPCLHPTVPAKKLSLEEFLSLAQQTGYTSADLDTSAIISLKEEKGTAYVKELLAKYGVTWASIGLPVNLSATDEEFNQQLEAVEKHAAVAEEFGITSCNTWLWPSIDVEPVPYACMLIKRIRQCADILARHQVRLGLEFVGPHHLRGKKYPFVYTIPQLLQFIEAIDRENVGVLLDTYHWYTTGESMEDLRMLPLEKIVHVHVNDTDKSQEEAIDNQRLLPGEGKIDIVSFFKYLKEIGYEGPLSLEILRAQEPTEGPEELTRRSMDLMRSLLAQV